jgi:hypothetical protein
MATKRINVKDFVSDYRAGLSDLDLMLKYDLDDDDLQNLFRKLLKAKILSEKDLNGRLTAMPLAARLSQTKQRNRDEPDTVEKTGGPRESAQPYSRKSTPLAQRKKSADQGKQICPSCSEAIPDDAVRCYHCGQWVDGTDLGVVTHLSSVGDRSQAIKFIAIGIAGMILGLMMQLTTGSVGLFVGTLLILAGVAGHVWGCCLYINTKGYHLAWGLLGLVPCFIGLVILILMPEK